MKRVLILLTLAAGLCIPVHMPAQIPVPPPAPDVPMRSAAELDQMLGPIALYPDPLIAQILPAATLPSEIVLADRYVSGGGDPSLVDQQGWDPSVQALVRYPALLQWLDNNLAWTTALGEAFLYQPQDVMDSIQRLRAQAQALGNLQSTPQQEVVSDDGSIDILPANPEVIYIPVYQPSSVYFERSYGGPFISFGVGMAVGAWLNHDFDWHDRHLITWSHDQPRPANWWSRRPSERPLAEAARATVWQPRNPSALTSRGGDRGWGPGNVQSTVTVIGGTSWPDQRRGSSTPPPQRSSPATPQRPASGALIGVQSSRDTRQMSSRGQQSRQAVVSRPAPAPAPSHSAAPARSESPRPAASSGKR